MKKKKAARLKARLRELQNRNVQLQKALLEIGNAALQYERDAIIEKHLGFAPIRFDNIDGPKIRLVEVKD